MGDEPKKKISYACARNNSTNYVCNKKKDEEIL